ncbi:MAG: hypothetical protein KAI70_04850, partial [Candidatus Omnitrophica bacterium]|nr:hypothetical protein [Candidatus Omnitrophota bacterium]
MQTKSKLYAAIAKAIVVIIIVNMVVPNRVFAEGRALFVHTLAPPAVTKPICEVWGAGSELRVVDPSEVIKERLKRSAVLFPNFSEAWSGMGEDIYEKYSVARNVYDEAAEIIGSEDVSELFLTEEDIYSKNISQKAVATVLYSVSIYKLFSKKLEIKIEPIISSGNCIGDITAAILSDAISLKDGIRIIRSFSDFFEKVCDNVDYEILKLYNSQMSKIEPFLSDGEIELFHDTSSGSEVSSKYTYINLTVYKEKVDVDNLIEKLREAGVVEIDRFGVPVDKGMHVSAYREALREYGGNLEKIIEKIEINDPKFPIISSAKGKVLKSVEDIRNNLKDQWFEPIKWSDVINKITDEGISSFLVFGPGEQLVKTISEMSPESRVIGVTNESDIDKVTDLFFKDRGYQERWGNRYIKEIVKKALQLGLSKHTLIAQIRAYAKKNTDVIKIFSKDIDVDLIEEVFEEGTLKAFYLPIVRDDRTIYRVKCSLKPGENVLLIEPKVSREQLTRVLVSLASFAHGTNKATEVREALTWLDPTFSKIMKSVPEDEELREPVSKLYGEISYVVDTLEDLYNKVLVAVKKGEFEPENILFWWAKTESIYEKFVKCRTDFYLLKMELKNILPEERLLQLEIVALYMNKLESMLKDRLFLMRGGIPDTVISINEVLDQFYENFMQPVVKFKDSGVHSPEVPRIANMVKIDIPEGLIRVRGNERSLISLICNIAANGYKYAFNYRGINAKVDIWTERKNGQLLIKIKDNGKGMTSGELKELETCFYTTEGTGIGLTEARLIAKDHGGSIEVETMLRKGTTFILRLPIVRDEKTINVPKERKEAIKRIVRSIIGFKSDEFDALIPRLVNFTKKLTRMQVEMRGKDGFTELNERQVLNAILREANIYCLHVKQLYEKALRYQEKEGIGKTKVFEWKANVVALSRQFNGFVDRYDKFCGRDEFQEFLAKEDEFETILADIDRSIVEVKAECKNVIASMDDSVMDDAIGEREVRILAGLAGFLYGTSSMLSTAHVDIFHVYFSILKRGFSEDKKHRALNFWAGKCSRKSRQMRDLVYRVSRSSMKAIVQKRFDVSVIQ